MIVPAEETRAVFPDAHADVRVEPLEHGPPAQTGGVWRVRAGRESAVLKLVRPNPDGHPRWPAGEGEDHPYYWRREPEAYESGLLSRLGDLRAPRLLALVNRPDGSVALWLEDVPRPATFTPELLGELARGLGAAQGAFAVELPVQPWLSRRWLRAYLALRGPLTRRQGEALAQIESAPQTFCHLDLFPGNLLGRDATVVADWAYCGLGALGEDPGNLVPDTLLDGFVEPARARELEAAVWEGYLEGLRSSPWRGDERKLRWVFLASAVLKYTWVRAALEGPDVDPERRGRWSEVIPLLHRWAEEGARL